MSTPLVLGVRTQVRTFSKWVPLILALFCVPAMIIRLINLSNPLVEPHPYRQTMSALITQHFFKNGIDLFHYQSPSGGLFWNVMHEFPVYQLCASNIMHLGISLEAASRVTTLGFFLGGAAILFQILNGIVGRTAATLSFVCYIISPFNIIYSRTGLIDFTAQFFMLAMILFTFRSLKAERISWNVGVAWISGALAALIKCYIWFVPVSFIFGALNFP